MAHRRRRPPATSRAPNIQAPKRAGHAAALLALLVGCTDPIDSSPTIPETEPPTPEQGCPPSETDDGEGGCLPAGIPAAACAPGFLADGEQGCEPLLPDAPCGPGQMALPGDESCQAVMSCGTGRWGDLITDGTTQHVDGSYAGGDSDGSVDRPWLTISEGVDAAEPGALVAVAEGAYHENVVVVGKPVRLWGRCPELVELVGVSAEDAALAIRPTDGTEIGGLAVTGPAMGVAISGARDVLLEQLWLHGLGWHGFEIHDGGGTPSVTVRHTLIETCRQAGVLSAGGNVALEAVVIRDILPAAGTAFAYGVAAQYGGHPERPSTMALRGCLIERNQEANVSVSGVGLAVAGSVIRDVLPNPDVVNNTGVSVQYNEVPDRRGSLVLRTSVLEGNGILLASADASVTATVFRQIPLAPGTGPAIIAGYRTGLQDPTRLHVEQSLVDHAASAGMVLAGTRAEIAQTVIRDTQLDENGYGGWGLMLTNLSASRNHTTVRSSLFERNHSAGVVTSGADVRIEHSLIRDQLPNGVERFFGRGLQIEADLETMEPTTLVVDDCLIDRHYEVGVFVISSDVIMTNTTIRETVPGAGDGWFGDGLTLIAYEGGAASAGIDGLSALDNERAGISNFGATIALGNSLIQCSGFALHGSDYEDFSFWYEDQGGNTCGCGEATEPCQVVSAGLQPPTTRGDEPTD